MKGVSKFTVKNVSAIKHDIRTPDNKPLSKDYFKGKKVVLLGVPGAFTPVCSTQHVPSFMKMADQLKQKGVKSIACVSVNDSFVMKAWAQTLKSENQVDMFADWNGEFTKNIGMNADLSAAALGPRCKRFVMVIDDGNIVFGDVENSPSECKLTAADAVLKHLEETKK